MTAVAPAPAPQPVGNANRYVAVLDIDYTNISPKFSPDLAVMVGKARAYKAVTPNLDALVGQKLLTGFDFQREEGFALVDVNPAKAEAAKQALLGIPMITKLVAAPDAQPTSFAAAIG
jgi:hypothetical protein